MEFRQNLAEQRAAELDAKKQTPVFVVEGPRATELEPEQLPPPAAAPS